MTTIELLERTKADWGSIRSASAEEKDRLLLAMAESLEANSEDILRENAKDMEAAKGTISDVMLDRLALTESRIHAMAEGIREAAALPDHVGRALAQFKRPNGMTITKRQVPLGLVAIIYERRPNVTSDAATQCIKSGNDCLLRSGKAVAANTPGKGGYADTLKLFYVLLCSPDTLLTCVDVWTPVYAALDAGQDLLRFRFYRPKEILERLRDLQREPLHFTVADGFAPDRQFFISADEIDKVLRGWDGSTDYRLGVYAFYATHKDKTEREKYLKGYHGEYSGHSGGNDNLTHTRGKGIEFSHGSITAPYAKVPLQWPEPANRIGELISQNKFLSAADWAAMPEYERKQLARQIVNYFMDTPEDEVRPLSQNAIADYWECVKTVAAQLSDADRMLEIYQNMLPAWEATNETDRHYTLRKQGIEAMRAYLDGTYSVFGLEKTLQTPTTEAVSERPAAEPEVSEPEPPTAEAETSEI